MTLSTWLLAGLRIGNMAGPRYIAIRDKGTILFKFDRLGVAGRQNCASVFDGRSSDAHKRRKLRSGPRGSKDGRCHARRRREGLAEQRMRDRLYDILKGGTAPCPPCHLFARLWNGDCPTTGHAN